MAEKTYSERLKPSGNSYGQAFAAAKKAGKKEFTWKGRDYTTVTKEERQKSLQKESRKEKFVRKEATGEGGGLTEKQAAFKTAKKRFGSHKVYTHKGKKYISDGKGDRPRRAGYETQVMAREGGRVGLMQGGFPKLAKKGWK